MAALLAVLAASPLTSSTPPMPEILEAKRAKEQSRIAESGYAGKRHDAPAEAMAFFLSKRSPDGKTPVSHSRYAAAQREADRMPKHSTRSEGTRGPGVDGPWTPLGPGNIGGRTRTLVIHPTTPDIMYAGGVAGGVWKTTNAGGTWAPLTDLMSNIAIGSLAMDPNNSDVLYAGTGEGLFNIDAVRGAGIFKTIDAGANWTPVGSTATSSDFQYVNDLVVSKLNANILYVATRTGVFQTFNGGTSWFKVISHPDCLDLVIKNDITNDFVLASCGTGSFSKVYRNPDADGVGTWDVRLNEPNMARTSLAIAPSDQSYVYALSASSESGNFKDGLFRVSRSIDGGVNWTTQVSNTSSTTLNTLLLSNTVFASNCPGLGINYYNQGWYDNVIAVDPADRDKVWAGGIDLFRSDDGGQNWGLASHWWSSGTNYAHADQHVIAFHPGYDGVANQTMLVGNDGGLFKTTNARAATSTNACDSSTGSVSWQALNNSYGVTQFYNGAVFPDGATYFGGTQDNGTVRGTDGGGADAWSSILGGDGGYVAVDPANTQILYAEFQNWDMQKSTDGGGSWVEANDDVTSNDSGGLFITPFVMDPNSSQTLWTGGTYLWRTTNGASSWTKASTSVGSNVSVSALAVAPGDSNRVLAGLDNGGVLRNTTALSAGSSTSWSSASPRSGYVSSVAFDPGNLSNVYATYSTFGGSHVWKSNNGGATWSSISGALPDIPVHDIVVVPDAPSNRLYIGTDLGVFVSLDDGATWAVENTGFANTVTESLKLIDSGGQLKLYAFTHGRGTYRVNVPGGSSPPPSTPLNVSIDDVTVTEGDKGSVKAVFRVHLSAPATVKVSVRATTLDGSAQSATKPKDFIARSKILKFKPGITEKFLKVKVKGDLTDEVDETFTVNLTEAVAVAIGDGQAVGTITDDDP